MLSPYLKPDERQHFHHHQVTLLARSFTVQDIINGQKLDLQTFQFLVSNKMALQVLDEVI